MSPDGPAPVTPSSAAAVLSPPAAVEAPSSKKGKAKGGDSEANGGEAPAGPRKRAEVLLAEHPPAYQVGTPPAGSVGRVPFWP